MSERPIRCIVDIIFKLSLHNSILVYIIYVL